MHMVSINVAPLLPKAACATFAIFVTYLRQHRNCNGSVFDSIGCSLAYWCSRRPKQVDEYHFLCKPENAPVYTLCIPELIPLIYFSIWWKDIQLLLFAVNIEIYKWKLNQRIWLNSKDCYSSPSWVMSNPLILLNGDYCDHCKASNVLFLYKLYLELPSFSIKFTIVKKQKTSLLTVLFFYEFFVFFYKHWLLLAHKLVILGQLSVL